MFVEVVHKLAVLCTACITACGKAHLSPGLTAIHLQGVVEYFTKFKSLPEGAGAWLQESLLDRNLVSAFEAKQLPMGFYKASWVAGLWGVQGWNAANVRKCRR